MENVILVPQQSLLNEIQDFTYVYTVDEEGKVSVVASNLPVTVPIT